MISSRLTPEKTLVPPAKPIMPPDSEELQVQTAEAVAAQARLSEMPERLSAPQSDAPPAVSAPRRAINKASEIRRKMPKSLKLKLKILFSLFMFGSLPLFLKIDIKKTWAVIVHTNVWILAATALLFILSIIANARRWQLLTRALGFKDKTFLEHVEYCYVGLFFNLFLPSTVGGDFSRCYYISKGTGKYAEALYSVLADRASGLAVLFATGTIGLLLGPGAKDLPVQLKIPVFVGTFGLFCVMPFMPVLTRRILGESNWIARRFNNPTALILWQDKRLVAATLGWSFFTQLIMVVCHIGVALSLGFGTSIPLWYYFVFYPCVAVLGFVTPSFNGIGIREWAYTFFLALKGTPHELALTYALVWLALTTLLSTVGGVVYVLAKLKPPPEPDQQEDTGDMQPVITD